MNEPTIDYTEIMEQLGICIKLALPIGLYMGIVERLISLVLDAALDRVRRRERI